jgi:tripartite-type tricarboxylate transporter receptor subunit TctC
MKRLIAWIAIALCCPPALADDWPSRPVKIVVGTAPGGTMDKLARGLANHLSQRLGQPFVVDNRPGAGGTLAAELVATAPADGYTLELTSAPTVSITPVLEKVRYQPIGDFEPIGSLGSQPYVLLVPYESKLRTANDVLALARANAGKFSYSSAGRGTGGHLSGELFSQITGVPMLHVPYRGVAPAINDVVAGIVSVTFATTSSSQGVVDAKKLRPIATTGSRRSPAYPDLPTMVEAGFPGCEISTWYGISAPAGTSKAIVATLNREINAFLDNPRTQTDLATDGISTLGGSPDEFLRFQKADQQRWRAVLEQAGLAAK